MAHEFDNMLRSLPAAYRTDAWVGALLGAVALLDDGQRAAAEDIAAQLPGNAMTWVLDIEERICGITPAPGATMEERRRVVQSRWRSATGKCDVNLIQRVCDSWRDGEIEVDFAEGVIVLRFVGAYGVPDDRAMAALTEAVQAVIPAHLAMAYLYRYLLVREVHGMGIDALQAHQIRDFVF